MDAGHHEPDILAFTVAFDLVQDVQARGVHVQDPRHLQDERVRRLLI